MLSKKHGKCKRPVKEDEGLAKIVLFQKRTELIANRLPKRNSVPCPTDRLCSL